MKLMHCPNSDCEVYLTNSPLVCRHCGVELTE